MHKYRKASLLENLRSEDNLAMGGRGALVNHFWLYFFILLSIFASSLSDSPVCVYTIDVKTGSLPYAGTDSNISMTLYDYNGFAYRIHNIVTWGGIMGPDQDYFERGNLDKFNGTGPCLTGDVCKLNLTSDGTGSRSGWYCEYVDVITKGVRKSYSYQMFNVNQWLSGGLFSSTLSIVRDNCEKKKVLLADSESSSTLAVI